MAPADINLVYSERAIKKDSFDSIYYMEFRMQKIKFYTYIHHTRQQAYFYIKA